MRRPLQLLSFILVSAFATSLSAQSWPTKPVRLVLGYAAGGAMDMSARSIAPILQQSLGQPFVVENRTGGAANIAAEAVARADADGHTILFYADAYTIAPSLFAKLTYDPVKDFAHVTQMISGAHILVGHPSVPASTLPELIAYAKANPGKLAYASPGNGTPQHLAAELFKNLAGNLDITHVPYRGGGQAIGDVVGGQIPLASLGLPPTAGHIKAGRLKAFAVTSKVRQKLLPDTPTFQEAGVAGFETVQWWGPAVPAATPAPVVQKIYDEFVKAMRDPKLVERWNGAGLEVTPSASPEAFTGFIKAEIDRWAPVVKASGARVDN
ncbi:MAG TPA: tripartite tricarboxylate transporter substrate-binding protein [Burkholderiales bacterium]|nr:tripartite tricarboxylate transporter substrate-binding protein [Burkholderiales bacterium]